MEYYDSIEKVIDYIEDNLKDDLTLSDLAKIACMSEYHFHRIFSFITGETVMKYVRKRRLTKATYELIHSQKPIIEIAFDYGYESQESFTRSFKAMFDETPKKYRVKNERNFLGAFRSKLDVESLKIKKGEKQMEYKVVEREKMTIVGLECETCVSENKAEGVIPKLWGEFIVRIREIENRANFNESFGICGEVKDFDPKASMGEDVKFKYIAGVEVTNTDSIPEGMKTLEIPKQKFVVFTHKGALDTLYDTYNAIYTKGFPGTGFKLDKAYEYELYDQRFISPVDPKTEMDIYIPIK